MDIVNDLIRRRAACEQEIAEQDRKIQEYERAYESLRRFDGAVDTAQSNFHNVNTVKLNRLEENFCCIPRISLFVVSSRMHRSGNRNGQGG